MGIIGRIMTPPKCPHPSLGICACTTLPGKIDFIDMTKLRIWRWRNLLRKAFNFLLWLGAVSSHWENPCDFRDAHGPDGLLRG